MIAHFRQRFVGTGDFRIVRFPFLGERLDPIAKLRHFPRIRHDDFFRFFRRQIGKFIEHFLRRPDVDSRMRILFPRFRPFSEQNIAIDLVLFEKEMRIGCRAARKAGFIRNLDDSLVERLHVLDRIHFRIAVVFDQKFIVTDGLHFEIIIKFGERHQFLIRFFVQNSAIKFAHNARGAVEQPVMQFFQDRLGNERSFLVIFQAGQRDQTIQIMKPRHIFSQNDDVAVFLPVGVRILRDVLNHITFHPVKNFLFIFLRVFLEFRENLNAAVVRDRNGRRAPFRCRLDRRFRIRQPVQTHFRMQMELDAHFLGIVVMPDFLRLAHFHPAHIQHETPGVFVQADIAAHLDAHSFFEILIERRRILIRFDETFPQDPIRVIRDTERVQPFPVPQFTHVKGNEIPFDDDIVRFFPNLGDIRRRPFDMCAPDKNAVPFFRFGGNGSRGGLRQHIVKTRKRRCHTKSRLFFLRFFRRQRNLVLTNLRRFRIRQRHRCRYLCAADHLHSNGRPRSVDIFRDIFSIDKNFFRKGQLGAQRQKCLQRRGAVRRLDVHRPTFRVDFHQRDGVRLRATLQSIFRHLVSSKKHLSRISNG